MTHFSSQEETLRALIDYIEQEQYDDYLKLFPSHLQSPLKSTLHNQVDTTNGDDPSVHQSKSLPTCINNQVLDQVFCSLTDLEMEDLSHSVLHGVLYVCKDGLSFAGNRRSSLRRVCWFRRWDEMDQFRVSYNSDQLCLYMITRKRANDGEKDQKYDSEHDDDDDDDSEGAIVDMSDHRPSASIERNKMQLDAISMPKEANESSGGLSEEALNEILNELNDEEDDDGDDNNLMLEDLEGDEDLDFSLMNDDDDDLDFDFELRPYLFTIQATNSDLFVGDTSTKNQELISSSSNNYDSASTDKFSRIGKGTYSSSQSATMDLSELNITNIRSSRWRSLLYVLSETFKESLHKKRQSFVDQVIGTHAAQDYNFNSIYGDDMKRACIYNMNFFKHIKLMTVDIPQFNLTDGTIEELSIDNTEYSTGDQRVSPNKEEEQEERVNKTTSKSVIIKDYFQEDEATYTDTMMDDDLVTYDGDENLDTTKQPTTDRFSLASIFNKRRDLKSIEIPLHPNKNVLLEYKDLIMSRSSFMKMSYKMVPAVLRVEEDKITKQVTLSIYERNSKRLKLLDYNIYDISSIKKIEVMGPNKDFLSIELANNSNNEGDDVTKWEFGQTNHPSGDSKSMDTISHEIYSVFYANIRK